jgi:hypothetical protein
MALSNQPNHPITTKREHLMLTNDRVMTTWKEQILKEMKNVGETFQDVVFCTLTDEQLLKEFYSGYGLSQGLAFTLWTSNRVYFPAVYDGAEWVCSVSRNPDGKPTEHVGGQ